MVKSVRQRLLVFAFWYFLLEIEFACDFLKRLAHREPPEFGEGITDNSQRRCMRRLNAAWVSQNARAAWLSARSIALSPLVIVDKVVRFVVGGGAGITPEKTLDDRGICWITKVRSTFTFSSKARDQACHRRRFQAFSESASPPLDQLQVPSIEA